MNLRNSIGMLSLLVATVAHAAPQVWGFKWKAPKGCIEPAELARGVEARLGFSVFGPQPKFRVDGELTRSEAAPRWRAKFITLDSEGSILGSRELTQNDANCRAFDDQLATVVAVMIDPKRQPAEPEPEVLPPPRPATPPEVATPKRVVSPEAQEEYERRLLHFGDWVAVNQSGAVVAQGSQLYQGKFMKPLTPVDFYRTLGDEQRVAKLESAGRAKAAVAIPGGALILLGLATMFVGIFVAGNCEIGSPQAQFDSCISTRNTIRSATLWGGVAGASVGALMVLGSLFIPYPVDELPVMREKADAYNRRLREELSIEPGVVPPQRERTAPNPQASLEVSPMWVAGRGLGAQATLRF